MTYKGSNYVTCSHCQNEFYGDEKMFDFHGSWLCRECFEEQVKKHYKDEIDEEDNAFKWAGDLNFYYTTVEDINDNDYWLAMDAIYESDREERLLFPND